MGLPVERRVGGDVVRDIGDVDADLVAAVAERAPMKGIVVVARIFGIDGEDETLAQVETPEPVTS